MKRLSLLLLVGGVLACGGTPRKAKKATPDKVVAEAFRKTKPLGTAPRPFQLPAPQVFEMEDAGVTVYLMEQRELPIVVANIEIEGGTRLDPKRIEGQTSICMSLLAEGTRDLDKPAFRERLADIGSSIGTYATRDRHGFSASMLSKHADSTAALLSDVIVSPGLRTSDLKRLVSRSREAVKQARGSAQAVASRVQPSIVYGARHARGRVRTEASLSRIRTTSCQRFHRRHVRPAGARLFVAGDMDEARVREVFAPLFAKWRGKAATVPVIPRPEPPKERVFFVHVPSSSQSTIALIHSGPKRTAKEYFANELMMQVLGRGFTSRINMNLREDKGYSYGARSSFRYSREGGHFAAGSSVRSDATVQSLTEILTEMRELKDGQRPVLPEELRREKSGMLQALPATFATAQAALGRYRSLVYYGIPLDFFNAYVANVQGVAQTDVQNAAQRELRPDDVRILVVGDGDAPQLTRVDGKDQAWKIDEKPVTLREALARFGSVVELDADGKRKR